MDGEQEHMKSLGFLGINKESYKVIVSWKKLFNQITLSFILPLSIIFLAQIEISRIFFSRIDIDSFHHEHRKVSNDWVAYVLFKLTYFTFLIILSLLSTSAVVYAMACIYTGRDVSFKSVLCAVPKVWKRLMVTFIVIYVAMFIYIVVAVVTIILSLSIEGTASAVLFIILLIVYSVGFLYMTVIWQLASVVTVLEDSYGIKAMKKSKDLIKGKIWVSLFLFFVLLAVSGVIQFVFLVFVVYAYDLAMWKRVGIAILCLFALVALNLFGLVVQTIIYFVCKSYHEERIDKPTLSKHLGEYERLWKPEEMQLGDV